MTPEDFKHAKTAVDFMEHNAPDERNVYNRAYEKGRDEGRRGYSLKQGLMEYTTGTDGWKGYSDGWEIGSKEDRF